ncbi:MAG: DNA repair protein RecN [Acidimicrobiales bacterium]
MLAEIRVRDLGVIEDLDLVLGEHMTALTGETGTGKTLVVEALELLLGGRADGSLVRAGAEAAVVEGRFVSAGRELVLRRELPREGRSRAYVDGHMAPASELAAIGVGLVDLHGQHSHQSLLHQGAQRQALDRFGGLDTSEVEGIEADLSALGARLEGLGGEPGALAREIDLLRFQVTELGAAGVEDPGEEARLVSEEAVLSNLEALRQASAGARALVSGDGLSTQHPRWAPEGISVLASRASSELGSHEAVADLAARLGALASEAEDVAQELRRREEAFEEDPVRLGAVRERLRLLSDLRRKYGETLEDVLDYLESAKARLQELESGESLRDELRAERDVLLGRLHDAEARLLTARAQAAPVLAERVEEHLHELALDRARFSISVAGRRGDEITFMLAANLGEPALPLARAASGGELARAMLALRLVLSEAPGTLVFDEVDAGVGGETAVAVGTALHQLSFDRQVLVVTHLAQVAAFADHQVAVQKHVEAGRTLATLSAVQDEERLAELSRMLSGQPGSRTARQHAAELLDIARGAPRS